MSEIKLIVCDLDGTLLNNRKEITQESIDTLMKAKEKGIKVCYASGRNDQMMSIYEDAIKGCDYILSCNGAIVRDVNKNVLYHAFMPSEQVTQVIHFLCENEMVCMLYTVDTMYYVEGCVKLIDRIEAYESLSEKQGRYRKLVSKPMNLHDDFSKFHHVTKIVAYEDNQSKIEKLKKFVAQHSEISYEVTGYGLLGVFSKHVSKFQGLEAIKKEMNITEKQVAVFGDFDNDISMFACAEMSVAMANASDLIKVSANYQCASNEENGVARFIVDKVL